MITDHHARPDFSGTLTDLVLALRGTPAPPPDQDHRDRVYHRLTERLAGNLDLESVLSHVLDQVAIVAHADRGWVALLDDQGHPTFSLVWKQEGDAQVLFPHSTSLIERLLTQKQVLWIPDVGQDPDLSRRESMVRLEVKSVVAVPMKVGEAIVGFFYLDGSKRNDQFSAKELSLIESMVAYATMAVSNARMHAEVSARAQKLQLINDVSLAISATVELDQLLTLILHHSLSLSGGDQGYVLLGDNEMTLSCLASLDATGRAIDQLGVSHSIVARCIRENQSICILDTHSDLLVQTRSVMALDLRSIMCIPLVANQQQLGVLYISSQAINKTFTPKDQSLLEAIANQAALAIRNAQLLKEQEHQIQELERALQAVREAQERAMTDGLTGLYNHVYFKEQLYSTVLEAERYGHSVSVVLVDLDHFKRVNDSFGHQSGDEVLRQVSALIRKMVRDCDVVSRYGGEELALLLPQTDPHGAYIVSDRIRAAIEGLAINSMAGEPIPVTASFGVAAYRRGLTSVELIEAADKALYAAKHGGRNRVCVEGQEIKLSAEELRDIRETQQDTFLSTVAALSEAVEAKDRYTAGHSHHVEALARRLGEAMGLGGRQLKDVELAAVLHDVGKIGIPDAILQKPGPLTETEWEIMRTHPVQGARILQAGNLPGLAQAIRHHHECWDGNGYPDGLKGNEIPLAARIVAVIDAYGAMTTDRVYRKAIGKVRAIEELRTYAGTQFDPQVVQHFLRLIGEELELPVA